MQRVALDVMGSDQGVMEVLRGAAQLTLEDRNEIMMLLVGDPIEIQKALDVIPHHPKYFEIIPTAEWLLPTDKAKLVLPQKNNASILLACRLVQEGRADAIVTAGNSGGVILAAAQTFQRLEGIRHVAFAAVLPTEKKRGNQSDPFALLLDVGATLHVSATDLMHFALMGMVYAQIVSNNDHPSIALLSNGSESEKGAPEVVEAHQQLRQMQGLNFIGNIEGLDIPRGNADVIVCEGFLGNVVLKLLEGITELAADLAKEAYESKLVWRLGLTVLSKELKKLHSLTDWKQYGGAPILGFEQVVIKAHGRSNAQAIRNAIKLSSKVLKGNLIPKMQEAIKNGQQMEQK